MSEPTRDQINQDYARALALIDELRTRSSTLLTSCKELQQALMGAMEILARAPTDSDLLVEAFVAEMARRGIAPGVGFRAEEAIAAAEGTRRPAIVITDATEETHAIE